LKEHLVIGCTNQQKFLDSLRPHIPVPDGCAFRAAKLEAMYDNGYADGAARAWEKVLDEIIKIAQANNCVHPDTPCLENYDCTTCIAKSLHTTTPKEQEQR
jgi:hypothetical protein